MNNKSILLLLSGLMLFVISCQNQQINLTESQKKSIIDSAKVTVQSVFDASNNLKFVEGLDYYSEDVDTYYTNNGSILTLKELKASYSAIGSSVEILENKIDSWNTTFLSQNTVAFTLPIRLKIKLKDIPEYHGKLIWSGIVQKRNNKWVIIQSHESWLNCAEVLQALTPPENIE